MVNTFSKDLYQGLSKMTVFYPFISKYTKYTFEFSVIRNRVKND